MTDGIEQKRHFILVPSLSYLFIEGRPPRKYMRLILANAYRTQQHYRRVYSLRIFPRVLYDILHTSSLDDYV